MSQWMPLRRQFRIVNGGTPTVDAENWNGDIPWATPVDLNDAKGVIGETQRHLSRQGALTGSTVVPAESIIVSTRAPIGYVARTLTRMSFNQGCRALVPTHEIDPRFFVYQLSTMTAELQSRGQGATFQEISSELLANTPVRVPTLTEQRQIADFLDVEISHIDRLRCARGEHLNKLLEYFNSEVKSTTGRNSCWSSHKNVLPLRRAVKRVKTGATPPSAVPTYFTEESGIPWFTPGSFGDGIELGEPQKTLTPSAIANGVAPRFQSDSIVIVGIGATAGKVAYLHEPASGNQQVTAIEVTNNVNSKFLAWQLWAARNELMKLAPYTTMPIINNDFLRSFPVFLPDRREQDRVASQIEQSWTQATATKHLMNRQLDLLVERRRALIIAAIAGKIDVTTARSGVH